MKAWPLIAADVVNYLGTTPSEAGDTDYMGRAVAGTVAWMNRNVLPTATPANVDDDLYLGAVMLAGRMYNRRTSTLGVASFGDLGVTMIVRSDPDIRLMLGLGKPIVG